MTKSVHASAVHLPVIGSAASYSYSRLRRFAQCPRSYELHYVDRLPAEPSPESELGEVLHATLEALVRGHVRAGWSAPLDGARAAAEYQRAWASSHLSDPAVHADGLALVKRWVAREGAVDPGAVLGVEHEFAIDVGNVRLVGAIDRVDRLAGDVVRIRDYKSARIPPTRQEVEENLQLALYDLAGAQLWPWARRIEVGLDLLRHERVVTVERTREQREATRQYVLAMVARIEASGDYPARLSTRCTHCDQRLHCDAYADAAARRRRCEPADEGDLAAVAREREELAAWLKVVGLRKDALDEILTQRLAQRDELVLEGRRYRLVTATRKDYPLGPALEALAEVGVARDEALERLGRVDGAALKHQLDALAESLEPGRLAALRRTMDAAAKCTLSTRLTSTEVAS
jgi:RecB family exonuclease